MKIIIGCDEAGYGPNLGPLVISATAWRVPDDCDGATDLYALLHEAVTSQPPTSGQKQAPQKLTVADSKLVYKNGSGLKNLELAVLSALAAMGRTPRCWSRLHRTLCPTASEEMLGLPWFAEADEPLPCDATRDDLEYHGRKLEVAQRECGVSLLAIRSEMVFPRRFNRLCSDHGTKGSMLSWCTLRLVREVIETLAPRQAYVICDKHGGRNRYAGLLQAVWEAPWVTVREESRKVSRYELEHAAGCTGKSTRSHWEFRCLGEIHLPVAWASLTSKYLRELAMRPFNAFFARHLPELKPTAGYPTDARRFLSEVSPVLKRLKIERELLWRER